MSHFKEAANTLKAKWWELWLAQLLGKKTYGQDDDGTEVTLSRWRGKYYLIDFKLPPTVRQSK